MKIYFAGSIRGGRDDKEVYRKIVNHLKKHGEVLTEHIGSQDLSELGEKKSPQGVYQRDIAWIAEADFFIADVSTPSLGVGYEIAKAEEMGKKILCLYYNGRDERISAMVKGNSNLTVKEYKNIEEAFSYIDDFLQ